MTEEKKDNVFGVILHSFFVVPFLLAILSVLLFAAVRLLTMEKHSAFDYLKDIQKGSSDKRWQSSFELFRQMAEKDRWHSAFELSKNLSAKDTAILQERFVQEMTAVYKQSKNDDPRVRLYLIMAMGKSGRKEFVDVLLSDLPTARDEHLNAMINALGMLESIKASVAIQTFLNNDNPRIRLAAVIALGRIKDRMAIPLLRKRLDDSEPNVIWDAAVALAKMGDQSGRGVILNLLNRDYYKDFPNVSPTDVPKTMMVAMHASASWKDKEIQSKLLEIFQNDPNMNVRNLAHQLTNQK